MPERIAVPKQFGILSLVVGGEAVTIPNWDAAGDVWLQRVRAEAEEKDLLTVQVYRVLEDGIPLWLLTEIDLTVSGKNREEQLGWILPEGWQLSLVESPIPVAVDDEGRMKAQVRAGNWKVQVQAFRNQEIREMRFAPNVQPLTNMELVGFRAKPDFRIAEFVGVPPIDVNQTTYPSQWRDLQDAMMRLFGLKISPATILDLTRRAADAVQSEYDAILKKIRGAPILYVDETSIHVQGERHWIWTFSTPTESFFVIRKSRGMKVLTEVLTRRFKGIIVCDGWKPYARFTNLIQRCWAHLLRESKEIAEKSEEAIPLHNALKELYEILIEALENDPPPKVRKRLWQLAREARPPPPSAGLRRRAYRAGLARDWEPRLDELWQDVGDEYPVAVVRDARHAACRLAVRPGVRYHRFLLFPRFSFHPVGFAAFRTDGGRVRWVDLVWDHRHPGALDLASHLSASLAAQTRAELEELWLNGDAEGRSRLERRGFAETPEPGKLVMVARAFDPEVDLKAMAAGIYVTMGDSDLV